MDYKCDLKTATVVWWRFFWRYAVIFVAMLLLAGICINLCVDYQMYYQTRCVFIITLLSGIFANGIATLSAMFYCLNRKFRNSSLILQGRTETIGLKSKLWLWLLYFGRFVVFTIALSFILGYFLPICFRLAGTDPAKALNLSRYIGNMSMIPASFLAFISMICRKEKNRTLRIAVSR